MGHRKSLFRGLGPVRRQPLGFVHEVELQFVAGVIEPMRVTVAREGSSALDVASRVTLLVSVPVKLKEVNEDKEVDEAEGAARDS